MSSIIQPLFWREPAGAPPPSFTTLYTKTALTVSKGWNNRNVVVITPIDLTGYSQFRVTIKNLSDASTTIDSIYMGQISSTVNFSAVTDVKFGGFTGAAFTAANQELVSDITNYSVSGTGKLGFAFHVNSNGSTTGGQANNGTGWTVYTKSGTDESSLTTKTGTYAVVGETQFTAMISKFEAQ